MNNGDRPAGPAAHDAISPGLTKREHFAAMAMQGLTANKAAVELFDQEKFSFGKLAVMFADQLLTALEETT